MKNVLIFSLFFMALNTFANPVTKPITNLFDAMRSHDGAKLLQQFTASALLQRAKSDGSIENSDIQQFANSINSSERYLDEHLLDIQVQIQDNLASVWTPYVFYLDNKLSHCGVNSFQLVLQNNEWKIHYLIDNSHPGDCEGFIKKYK